MRLPSQTAEAALGLNSNATLAAQLGINVTNGRVLAVMGGVNILMDLYHLGRARQLLHASQCECREIRKVADQLETSLNIFRKRDISDLD